MNFPIYYKKILDLIKEEAKKLNIKLYLYGGFLRDFLSGELPVDLDIFVQGITSTQFTDNLLKKGIIDSKKDLIGNLPFKESVQLILSQTTIKDISIDFVSSNLDTIEEYIKQTDFTINSLYYDLLEDKLYDLTKLGIRDILNKVLRLNSSDLTPIAGLRAIKFMILKGYTATPEVIQSIKEKSEDIKKLDKKIIYKILSKCLKVDPEKTELILKQINLQDLIGG